MSNVTKIDDCLSTSRGRLFIEQCDTVELIEKFGSPLFAYSEDQLRRNIRRFQQAFGQGWPGGNVKVMPAAKANWIEAVQRVIVDEGCGADIYSPGELDVCLRAGFDPQYISVNGVPKRRDHILRCVKEGVRVTIDSIEEVDMIQAAVAELNMTAHVRLRLKPALSGFIKHSDFSAEGLIPTDLAAIAYKGGLSFEMIREVAPRIMAMDNVELMGFHEHHGRHHRSTQYWQEQMRAYAAEIAKVCDLLGGYRPKEIDIGGGFAVYRDPFAAAVHYDTPLQFLALHGISKLFKLFGDDMRYRILDKLLGATVMKPNQKKAPTIEQYGQACTGTLTAELRRHGIDPEGVMLQLEPGRCLHGDCGVHLTTVQAIKRITSPIRYNQVVTDSTEFWFTGGIYEHHLWDYVFANKTDAPKIEKADINGRSCYGDRIIPLVMIPRAEVGDILAMLDTGSYQEVSMSNFNAMPRPATVMVSGGQAEIIRRAEDLEDVFRRDVVPQRLRVQTAGAA